MYIYVFIHIYSVYMLLYKKASLLSLWVNTFYSTITITTVYIPNQNALIIYQEDVKQSVDHDQEVCNNMLSVTAILCVCMCVYGCEMPTPLRLPSDTNARTHPEKTTRSAVSLVNFASAVETWSRIYFCCPADFGAACGWTFRVFLQLCSLCFQT